MTIRKMTLDDYEAVYGLWFGTPGMGLNDVDDSRAGIDNICGEIPTRALSPRRTDGWSVRSFPATTGAAL